MCERRKCLERTFGTIEIIFYKDIGGLIFHAFSNSKEIKACVTAADFIDLDENLYCCYCFEQLLY